MEVDRTDRPTEPIVRDNPSAGRYELVRDGRVIGVADYVIDGDVVIMPHTEIVAPLRGHGLGAILVQGALDDIRSSGRTVVARCWFVADHLRDHPELADLVAHR